MLSHISQKSLMVEFLSFISDNQGGSGLFTLVVGMSFVIRHLVAKVKSLEKKNEEKDKETISIMWKFLPILTQLKDSIIKK